MNIKDLTGSERDLVVVALQALWRERANGYNTAMTACHLAGKSPPSEEVFGLNEVSEALRLMGAAPIR
ncbi:hypothetical protein MPI44_004587 [Klebsiella oxytoca]|nr:hypothetical protein [Klebsiella oxytoca]